MVCCSESAVLAVTAYVPGETLTSTSKSSTSEDGRVCQGKDLGLKLLIVFFVCEISCKEKVGTRAPWWQTEVKIQLKAKVRMKSSGNSYCVVWSCCRGNFPRTWRLVEPRQVPPLIVTGLSATARLIETL